MPDGNLTLLDLAIRNGDNIAAVVEDVTTAAPEWGVIPAAPRLGTSYEILRRVGVPSGGFRKVGDGVAQQKSQFVRETKPMFVFEANMNIGEDIVKAQTGASRSTTGDVLADEAIAHVEGSAITMGLQTWYGINANADGFAGLATQVSDEIDAQGGAGNDTASAYLLWIPPVEDLGEGRSSVPRGVHFSVGLDGVFQYGEWMRQQVEKGGGKKAFDYVNNFMFYVGLATASAKSIWRIRNLKTGHAMSDALGAQLLAKIPLSRRGNLRWFMNRDVAFQLQASRPTSVVVPAGGVAGGGAYPELPTSCQGFPITFTDSLVSTEKNGNCANLPDLLAA